MTDKQADQLVMLLIKLVKLQRLMRSATVKQRADIFTVAGGVIDKLVESYGSERGWCEALLTFGGQYYGQDTLMWIGDTMDDSTVADSLKAEVYRRNGIPMPEKGTPHSSQDDYEWKGAAGLLSDSQQSAYNFYHAPGSYKPTAGVTADGFTDDGSTAGKDSGAPKVAGALTVVSLPEDLEKLFTEI